MAAAWAASGPTTTVGMLLTLKLAAYPNTTSSTTGSTIIIATVRRSRLSWRNSLATIAHMRSP